MIRRCKAPGCEKTARSDRGPFAYCDEHRRSTTSPRPKTDTGGYAERARRLTRELTHAGRRLDQAKTRAQAALLEARAAQAEWDKLVRDLSTARQGSD